MRKLFVSLAFITTCLVAHAAIAGSKVEFKTTMGNFVVELDDVKAPRPLQIF